MADTTICFYVELNGARAGFYCMAGEANMQLARSFMGGIGWIWDHCTVQKMVPIENRLMSCRWSRNSGPRLYGDHQSE